MQIMNHREPRSIDDGIDRSADYDVVIMGGAFSGSSTALLLKRQANFSWMTCGGLNLVGITTEVGANSLLILEHGKYVLSNNIEAYETTIPAMCSDRLRNAKFAGPETMGPEGQPNESVGENPTQRMGAYEARLFFRFGAGLTPATP